MHAYAAKHAARFRIRGVVAGVGVLILWLAWRFATRDGSSKSLHSKGKSAKDDPRSGIGLRMYHRFDVCESKAIMPYGIFTFMLDRDFSVRLAVEWPKTYNILQT